MRWRQAPVVGGLLWLTIAAALAQPAGGPFALRKAVVAAGSGNAEGGVFRIQGTAGQPEAGPMAGGNYRVSGGFWPKNDVAGNLPDRLFADGFEF